MTMATHIDPGDNRTRSINEKAEINQLDYPEEEEKHVAGSDIAQKLHIDHGYDPAFIKKTTRQIDWRLIPPLIAMYCISSIDRKNVSLARAANKEAMQTELKLGTDKYNIITLLL